MAATSPLLTLPNELLADVASRLSPSSIHSLQLSSRRLFHIAGAELHAIFTTEKDAIFLWAASHNNDVLMHRAIRAGAQIPLRDLLDNKNIRSTDNTARVLLDVWVHSVRQQWDLLWLLLDMIRLRHFNVVRMMLERGMVPDRPASDAGAFPSRLPVLCFGVLTGSVEIVQLLLSYGFNVHTMVTPKRSFLFALKARNMLLLKVLLDAGILPLVTLYRGNGDPVHATARCGTVAIMQLLLLYGANVDAAGKYGRTPLHQTVLHPYRDEMRRFLLDNGADVNAKDLAGYTPLHRAVCRGNVTAVRMLLEYGADIGRVRVHSWDPVHAAPTGPWLLGPREDVRKVLLEAGVVLEG